METRTYNTYYIELESGIFGISYKTEEEAVNTFLNEIKYELELRRKMGRTRKKIYAND